jgi:hypothetical protein
VWISKKEKEKIQKQNAKQKNKKGGIKKLQIEIKNTE